MSKSSFSVYRIGRGAGVDIQIDDDSVSRVHAELIATQAARTISPIAPAVGAVMLRRTASGNASARNLSTRRTRSYSVVIRRPPPHLSRWPYNRSAVQEGCPPYPRDQYGATYIQVRSSARRIDMATGQGIELEQRLKVSGVSLLGGVVFIAIMSFVFDHPDSAVGAFLLDRHTASFLYPFTIQNVMWLMFWVGCGELWVRFNQARLELQQIAKHYLPEEDEVVLRAQDLGDLYQKVRPLAEERVFFLQRLIMRCILQFQGSRSVDQANSLFNSSLELFQHELELKYAMLRYLVWLIPTLGFIGTVVGIAFALDYAANIQDPQDPTLLAGITGRLGVAFYTTLLALLQSVLLVFTLHIAESREEMALNQSGQYCLDNLINRLYEK